MGTKDKNKIYEEVQKITNTDKIVKVTDIMQEKEFENLSVKNYAKNTRAFVKIQDGCDRYCTYCIIPYTRGKVRSRKLGDIIKEVTTLAENGYKEVVLTGIHVASYGKDFKKKDIYTGLIQNKLGSEIEKNTYKLHTDDKIIKNSIDISNEDEVIYGKEINQLNINSKISLIDVI